MEFVLVWVFMSFAGCISVYALDLLILPLQLHGISFLLTDYCMHHDRLFTLWTLPLYVCLVRYDISHPSS